MDNPYASTLLERAVQELTRLPGVGRKTALRFALHLLKTEPEAVRGFCDSIFNLRTQVKHLLRKYKYPPEQAKGAIDIVIRQAELMSANIG